MLEMIYKLVFHVSVLSTLELTIVFDQSEFLEWIMRNRCIRSYVQFETCNPG